MKQQHRLVDRRTVLKAVGGAVVGGTLINACSGPEEGSGDGDEGSGDRIVLAKTGPEEGDTEQFYAEQLKAFEDETGIQVELQTFPLGEYANAIQLLFSDGNAPDVFRTGGTRLALPVSYLRGWTQPLNDYVTDEYLGRYSEGSFDPVTSGLHIGDELHATPLVEYSGLSPLFVNIDLLEQYGGTSTPPETWGELLEVAERISRDSKGKVSGFSPSGANPAAGATALQATAGPSTTLINYQTGEAGASLPSWVEAMGLLQELSSAGVFATGWEAWKAVNLFQNVAQGRVAMFIAPIWHGRAVRNVNPDINLQAAPVPFPDSGRAGYAVRDHAYVPYWNMSSETRSPEAAWRLLDFMGTSDFQNGYLQAGGISSFPALPRDTYEDLLDELDRQVLDLREEYVKLGPSPMSKSIDAAEVEGQIAAQQPKPTFLQEIIPAALTDGTSYDYRANAEQFDQECDQVIEQQIKAARDDGKEITREAFIFPDWDPLKDYQPS